MSKVIDVKYLVCKWTISEEKTISLLNEKVRSHLKEGWVLLSGIVLKGGHTPSEFIAAQTMVKYEQPEVEVMLGVRRKPNDNSLCY